MHLGIGLAIDGATGSSGPAWEPSLLTAPRIYVDPALSSSTTVEDAAVSTLADLSANAFPSFTQIGANRPTYKATGVGGKPALLFTAASSQSMVTTGTRANCMSVTADYFWFVLQPTTIATDAVNGFQNIGVLCDGLNNYRGLYLRSNSPRAMSYAFTASNEQSAYAALPGGLTARAFVQIWHESGTNYVQVNADAAVSATCANIAGAQTLTWLLGRGAGGYFNGLLAEWGACAARVSGDQTLLSSYVNAKYAIW